MKKLILMALLSAFVLSGAVNAQNKTAKIDKLITSYFDTERFMGTVLVAENGKVLYKKGFGDANMEWKIPNGPNGVFRIASITKTFTAVITMQLVQEGKLTLESKISDFLPYYRKDIGEKITIHQLLTHTSGIPNYLQLPGFMSDQIKFPMKNVEEFIKKFCSNDLEFTPGSKFSYNNSGFAILGAIIEKVTGMTFEESLKKRILEPAGMNNTGLDRPDLLLPNRVSGYVRNLDGSFQPAPYWDLTSAYTAGQIYSTVDDMLKYHEALMGEKLLKNDYKKLMLTKYYPAFGGFYGYGWMLTDLETKENGRSLLINSHEGGLPGFNLYFSRIPEKNQVAIVLNNTSNAPLKEISRNIFCILNDLNYELPKKSLARETHKIMIKSGQETALRFFNENKMKKDKYTVSEDELNRMGYQLMLQNKKTEAVAVFRLTADEFPQSANAFDSLAEGYMNLGDKENAVRNYRKSLEMNPQNANAEEMLKKLEKM